MNLQALPSVLLPSFLDEERVRGHPSLHLVLLSSAPLEHLVVLLLLLLVKERLERLERYQLDSYEGKTILVGARVSSYSTRTQTHSRL